MTEYQPGVCNIGPEEIKRRHQAGYLGLLASALLLGLLFVFNANPIWRLVIFFPVTVSATGFLQAYFHFCAAFGLRGVYNLVKSAGQTDTVLEAEFRKKDKQKSLQIIGLALLIGLVAAILAQTL